MPIAVVLVLFGLLVLCAIVLDRHGRGPVSRPRRADSGDMDLWPIGDEIARDPHHHAQPDGHHDASVGHAGHDPGHGGFDAGHGGFDGGAAGH